MESKKRLTIILLIAVVCIITVVISTHNSIPRQALYNLDLRIFSGKMTYKFFDKLSECEKYTSPTDTSFGFTLAIPIVIRENTKIEGIKDNYCVIKNYHSEYFGRMNKKSEWYIPLDFSNDLGVFIKNYMKHPEDRIELKDEFYSKYKILDNQYEIVHNTNPKTGASDMKFVQINRNEIARKESIDPTSLKYLNDYIVTNNMRVIKSEKFDNREEKVNFSTSGKKVGYKGTFCQNDKCSKYSLSKKYDEITMINPPHKEIHGENTLCPYFLVKLNNKELLIDKDENNLLGEYDSFELINSVPKANYYYNFFKIKKNGKYGVYRLPANKCDITKFIIPAEYDSFDFKTVASGTTPTHYNIITAYKNNLKDLYFEYFDKNKNSEEYTLVFNNIKSFQITEKPSQTVRSLQEKIKIKDSALKKLNDKYYDLLFKEIFIDNKPGYISTCQNRRKNFFILKRENNSDGYDLYEY